MEIGFVALTPTREHQVQRELIFSNCRVAVGRSGITFDAQEAP
jgi:hypothetical protein